jgi:hypothetical protein
VKNHPFLMPLLVPALALLLSGCGDKAGGNAQATAGTPPAATGAAAQPAAMPGTWQGTVAETMNSGGYTYVLLDTGAQQVWCATTQTPVAVGDKVTIPQGQLMVDFRSPALDRVFPEIYFTSAVWQQGSEPQGGAMPGGHPGMGGDPHGGMGMGGDPHGGTGMGAGMGGGPAGGGKLSLDDQHVSGIQKVAGGYQVGEIHARSAELAGKAVKVRARVVKFTPNIMGTNWVHIQDGSGEGATVDLTVTTAEIVAVGDVIVAEGILAANKDFGAGYVYAAIIEKATVTKE